MKDRILRLCKRLNKFTLDEIEMVSEIEADELLPILNELIFENRLVLKDNIYFYCKNTVSKKQVSKLPLFFQFHETKTIDYLIKGFCSDVEALKMINIFDVSKHVINNFYQYFRTVIYEKQLKELMLNFEKTPKIPQERIYLNTKVYLYLYNGKLFVSEKYLTSKNSRKHTNEERLEIKNIYLKSYRKVLSRSFAHKFHLHLAEEVWKYVKNFNEQYLWLKDLLFS